MTQEENNHRLYTVKQFIEKQKGSWPSEGSIRAIIFDSIKGKNNFKTAFKRVNRRILVDSVEFWKCVDRMQEQREEDDN